MKTVKTWYLPPPYTSADTDWFDSCELKVQVDTTRLSAFDSGWCDMSTGRYILTNQDKVFIHTESEKEEMWFKLRYIDRAELYQVVNVPEGQVLHDLDLNYRYF